MTTTMDEEFNRLPRGIHNSKGGNVGMDDDETLWIKLIDPLAIIAANNRGWFLEIEQPSGKDNGDENSQGKFSG